MRRPPPLSELIHYPVTGGVCLLAIVATLCSFAGFNVEILEVNYLAFHGQPWRLITTIFPHVDAFHLIFNLYWTWVFGALVESEYGSIVTAALMFLFAAGASGAEYALAGGGIGLSGVGYGLFGFIWMLSRYHPKLRDAVDKNTAWLFVGWFFFCIVTTWSGYMHVANVAHGAGCVIGIITGFAFCGPRAWRIGARFVLPLCILSIGLLATIGRRYVNFTIDGGMQLSHMADRAFDNNDWARAAKYLQEAVTYHRTEARWWFNLGVAYQNLGRHADSIAAMKQAVAVDPLSKELKGNDLADLGEDAFHKGDYKASADWLHRAIIAGQKSEEAWHTLGRAYERLGQGSEASEAFEHATRLQRAPATTTASDDSK